ncbi:pentapeptide repeat-containing protein [Geothrix sp. 21YS21S-2]|uniref:pentapeptide repeat-containing protein n=1 Tax=Geothrix sp. 21YS21S-2 TaxID=3068893 RepID=UPI0027B9FE70|nr:pentapeptide repeat-containing protein [Geothrix sp. 21YS21S-2]
MHATLPVALGLLLGSLALGAQERIYSLPSGLPPGSVGALGTGITTRSKRVNGRLAGPGARLENADLRGADFAGRDLTGARLDGADCTGATFRNATLTGASLKGTRLFQADISGATGLDLAGAQLHPFFEPAGGPEKTGALRFFHTGGEEAPRFLVASPWGEVFWLEGSALRHLSPTGVQYGLRILGEDQAVKGLAKDSLDRLWVFGDRRNAWLLLADLSPGPRSARGFCHTLAAEPGMEPVAITAGPGGDVLVSISGGALHFHAYDGKFRVDSLGTLPGIGPAAVATMNAAGTGVFLAGPERTDIRVVKVGGRGGIAIDLPAGCRADRLVRGAGNTVWFTLTGSQEGIGCFDEDTRAVTFTKLPPGGGPRMPWDLALDAEGAVWFTQRGRSSLGRLKPGGEPVEFPLPEGFRASELVRGPGGRMFFTVEGERLIGSVLAVPPLGEEKKASPGGGWDVAVYAPPRVERRKPLTDAGRRERHGARVLAAEERYRAWTEPAPAPQEEVKSAPIPAGPQDRLAALDVNLSWGALRSILAKHGYGSCPDKSQFAPEYGTPAALAALIAEGMENAGAIGRVRVTDAEGHFLTFCEKADVGTRFGSEVPTGRFVVRTLRHFNGEHFEHDVIGAYPTR